MLRALILSCLALTIVARSASAEWHISPTVGLTIRARTNAAVLVSTPITTRPNIGGAVAILGGGIVGIEGVGMFTPSFKASAPLVNQLIRSSRTLALMANVVVTTPRRWTEYSLRPFVSAGLGAMRLSVVDTGGLVIVRSNTAGFNVGGGAVGFFSKRTGVRFDLRYFRRLGRANQDFNAADNPQLSYLALSAGVVFRR